MNSIICITTVFVIAGVAAMFLLPNGGEAAGTCGSKRVKLATSNGLWFYF
jgi:hypothetical protein